MIQNGKLATRLRVKSAMTFHARHGISNCNDMLCSRSGLI